MRHYLVSVVPSRRSSEAVVETVLDEQEDWYRFRKGCWVVYSGLSASDLAAELESCARPDGSLLVAPFDHRQANGWMTNDFWQWFRNH